MKTIEGLFLKALIKKIEEISGYNVNFVQDNQSISKKGTLRGLHFQTGAHAQAKLVRVIKGEVLDVAVDLRPDSKTYKKHFAILLNDQNNFQLFVPISKSAIFAYKCDNYYHKSSESGIIYNDPDLNIDWKLDSSIIQLSEKDKELPYLKDIVK